MPLGHASTLVQYCGRPGTRAQGPTGEQSPQAHLWPHGTAACDLGLTKQTMHVVWPPMVDSGTARRPVSNCAAASDITGSDGNLSSVSAALQQPSPPPQPQQPSPLPQQHPAPPSPQRRRGLRCGLFCSSSPRSLACFLSSASLCRRIGILSSGQGSGLSLCSLALGCFHVSPRFVRAHLRSALAWEASAAAPACLLLRLSAASFSGRRTCLALGRAGAVLRE